jgi:hypothetical protein
VHLRLAPNARNTTSQLLRQNQGHRLVGKLGNIYRDEDTRRRTFGVDWASEFNSDELERISPAEYHASPTYLKLSRANRHPGPSTTVLS